MHDGGADRTHAAAERARIRRWDVAVTAWVLVCLVLAVWTAIEIAGLRSLTDTLDSSSRALGTTADVLRQLEGAPFVGDDIGAIADGIAETSDTARDRAAETRSSLERLAALIGVSIFVLAVIPPTVAYLAVRRAWVRSSDHDPAGRAAGS